MTVVLGPGYLRETQVSDDEVSYLHAPAIVTGVVETTKLKPDYDGLPEDAGDGDYYETTLISLTVFRPGFEEYLTDIEPYDAEQHGTRAGANSFVTEV